jgi:hypothetical protein
MPSPSPLQRLLQRQGEALQRLEDAQVARFLGVFDAARRELREQLDATAPGARQTFTARQAALMLAQVEGAIAQLQGRLTAELDGAIARQQRQAVHDLVAVLTTGDRLVAELGNRIEVAALSTLSEPGALLLHRASLRRYGAALVEECGRQLAKGGVDRALIDRIATFD